MNIQKPVRWFRFIRTALVLTTLLTLWVGWNLHCVRKRQRILNFLAAKQVVISYDGPPPWRSIPVTWSLLGAKPVRTIHLEPRGFRRSEAEKIAAWFPESDVSFDNSDGRTGWVP